MKPYNAGGFKILKKDCSKGEKKSRIIALKAKNISTNEIVWAIGDDRVCTITRVNCVPKKVSHSSDLIKEIPFINNSYESVGEWKDLIEELVINIIDEHLEHNGFVHIYPQWIPKQLQIDMSQESFKQVCERTEFIILHDNDIMEFVPKE